MGGDENMEEDAQYAIEQRQLELSPCGSGQHQTETMHDYIIRAAAMPIRQAPREELGPLPIFTIPAKARNGPPTVGTTSTEVRNT
jgi:hypothetical protein